MGILLAFVALISWGFGDFLIQKSTREFGDWMALFYITAFGAIVQFPFVYRDIIPALQSDSHALILWGASIVVFLAAIFEMEALRIGKISVIEPIYAVEIPVAAVMAALLIHETLGASQIVLVAGIVLGIVLISTRSFRDLKGMHLEKGVWLAFFATIGMGVTNFLFGVGARETSPLMINWFTDAFVAVVTLFYLVTRSESGTIFRDLKSDGRLVLGVSILDNLAWIAFAYSMLYIPIAVATGISEGYIAFAGALGLLLNREKLSKHQLIGFFVAIVSVIALAFVTK